MIIKQCSGYELEKAKPNTSEDFFNRSEVTFIENGEEKALHVLYVRYFEEKLSEFTPFKQDPVIKAGDRDVFLKDIVALVYLLKNSKSKQRKRVYINSEKDFADLFQGIDFEKVTKLAIELEENQSYEVRSSLEFTIQPAS
ncbi:hypothetical protein [Bacillus sp. B15-48]|uniref:hypothetical protein n=1 Tax=Bacillus sp. B15-48 TaxID=1548601 RepID=UPI001940024A|nr:hypothetical protein [Bacillus sp. B15-48]MBM4762172.1 hypothetical protein [Bacillus sp. B15-48]